MKPRIVRPQTLNDFIGQDAIKHNMAVVIEAAKNRQEAVEHMLLSGPAGLGKTTLAQIVACEMGVPIKHSIGPAIARAGDLASIVTQLEARSVLFIDEIHRLHPAVEEMLYTAMEDFRLNVVIGSSGAVRSVRIDLEPFTLIGATTRSGLVSRPLRERFGLNLRLSFYDVHPLSVMIEKEAVRLELPLQKGVASAIAMRARGTPRNGLRLLRRLRDFLHSSQESQLTMRLASEAFATMGIDELGLDDMDRHYLTLMASSYKGGPVGVETMAAAMAEERDVLESVVEPFLVQQGMVLRTKRGRMLSAQAWQHLDMTPPAEQLPQGELFDQEENDE